MEETADKSKSKPDSPKQTNLVGHWAMFVGASLAVISLATPIVAYTLFFQPITRDTTRIALERVPDGAFRVAMVSVLFGLVAVMLCRTRRQGAWIVLGASVVVSIIVIPWSSIAGVVLRWRQ